MLREAGIHVTQRKPDVGVVVGGDGIFSDYGRLISIPLLFVGVRSAEPTASQGYLAEVRLDHLSEALKEIEEEEVQDCRVQAPPGRDQRGHEGRGLHRRLLGERCRQQLSQISPRREGKGASVHRLGHCQRGNHLHERGLDRLLLLHRQAGQRRPVGAGQPHIDWQERSRGVPHRSGPDNSRRHRRSTSPVHGSLGVFLQTQAHSRRRRAALRDHKVEERHPRAEWETSSTYDPASIPLE